MSGERSVCAAGRTVPSIRASSPSSSSSNVASTRLPGARVARSPSMRTGRSLAMLLRVRRGALIVTLLCACDGGGGAATLIVQVRTDLRPGLELAAVEVEVRPAGAMAQTLVFPVDGALDWGGGVRVAEVAALPLGETRLVVSAHDDRGAEVVARPALTNLGAGVHVLTVLLTRDCAGIECDDPAAPACLGGECVPETCTEESPELCPSECASDADCPASPVACAVARCTSGTCFSAPDNMRCGAGELCHADRGCELPEARCMADADCSGGRVCAYVFREGVCREACEGDTCRSLGDVCVEAFSGSGTHACVGDPCDPVVDTGCPGGVCSVLRRRSVSGTFVQLPICRPAGESPPHGACVSSEECATGAGCYAIEVDGTCAPWCRTSADCGDGICVEPVLPDFGYCSAGCDPFAQTGCPDGRACALVLSSPREGGASRWTSFCSAAGATPAFGSCSAARDCEAGLACAFGSCMPVCEVGGVPCGAGYTCQPLSPAAIIAGAEYGLCAPA